MASLYITFNTVYETIDKQARRGMWPSFQR